MLVTAICGLNMGGFYMVAMNAVLTHLIAYGMGGAPSWHELLGWLYVTLAFTAAHSHIDIGLPGFGPIKLLNHYQWRGLSLGG